ncbi:MAG: fibronectin type III domain-containing protein [Lysobacterales bacterium]
MRIVVGRLGLACLLSVAVLPLGARERERVQYLPYSEGRQSAPISIEAEAFGITPPLRDTPEFRNGPPLYTGVPMIRREENNEVEVDRVLPGWDIPTIDPLAPASRGVRAPFAMPTPALSFDGIDSNTNLTTFGTTSMPPDTVGDVGPNHYVQAVNFGTFRVYNKSGTPLGATLRISSLFAGLPASNKCRTVDNGDPVVLYDPLADRWLITQFAISGPSGEASPPNFQCIAVSVTGDPTGAYYAYGFRMPNDYFHDYPHFGVWPDGYYAAAHEFNSIGTAFVESGFFAFNRDKMLVGDPSANYIYIGRSATFGHLPADIDGYMPPPAGTPAMFFENVANEFGATADAILAYEFVPNYTTPALSTLTAKPAVNTAAFDPRDPSGRNDVEQPSPATTAQYLDAIGNRMLQRITYRNLGTVASPVHAYTMNWNVNVSGVNPTTVSTHQEAIRWTEMRRSAAGVMSIFDQGTHAPDAVSGTGRNRWMGSIAQDHQGNLALGFSRSGVGATDFPDIVWAGRSGGAVAAGTMNEGEATVFASTGVQQSTSGRWGDYSAMSVDPADECTFWYTTEYRLAAFNGTGSNNPFKWNTRIANFKFPACTAAPKGNIAVTVTECSSGNPINGATVTANPGGFNRQTQASGALVSNIIAAPGSYTVAASFRGQSASTSATVTNGATTNVNLCLTGPFFTAGSAAITAESCPVANTTVDPGETITVNLPVQSVAGSTTNLVGTLQATGGVLIAGAAQNYGALSAGGAAVTRPFTFTVSPTVQCGAPLVLTLALSEGATNLGTLSYSVPVTLAAGSPQTFNYAGAAVAIPDNNGTGASATVALSGLTGRIQDLNFRFNGTANTAGNSGLDHTWVGDLGITLTSPSGTTSQMVGLINDTSGVNGNCANDNFFNTILDDEAAGNPINSQCAVGNGMTGTFKPDNLLSVFDGEDPNGTWTMTAKDGFAGDTGTIRAFGLVLTPYTCCQSKVWTGASSTAWATAGNWSPSGAPGASDHVVIPSTGVSNEPSITTAVSVGSLALASGRTLTVGVGGSLTVSNTALSQLAGSVIYAGNVSQSLLNLSYTNLTINNAAGVSFSNDTTVTGTLTLTLGQLSSAGNTLTLSACSAGALSGGGASSYVRAPLLRCIDSIGTYTFAVGTANGYSPVSLSGVSGSGNFTVLAIQGANPNLPTNGILRYWTLTRGAGVTSANLLFAYLLSDIPGGANESTYRAYRIDAGPTVVEVGGTVNTVAHTVSVNGVSQFSDWGIAGPSTTVPDPPTIGTATAGNAQVSVSFTPPANNGGSAITGYTATCGAQSQSGPGSPIVVTGLTNGTPVTCTVIATNGVGNSAPSAASNSVTPATVPNAPTIGTATAGNAQVSVTFTPPASNGGSAITGYTATCGAQSQSGPGSPIVVTGLTNGTPVTCTVIATNGVGNSAPSAASNSVTPATVPNAPTIGVATAGNAQVSVSFTPPANNGGSAITGYTATCGAQSQSGPSSPIVVTGLTNGTPVTCTVIATNGVGNSVPSAASNSVTPATVPNAPTIGTATAGNAQVSVSFTPPANNGGSAITGYTATCGAQSQSGPSSPIVVTGLTNGTPVTCTVIATNSVGNSAPSAASNSVTPATVPNAPTIGTATAGNAQVSVTFTPPANNGGSAITGYTATCGAQSQSGPGSPIVVTGLTNGTPVTCTVIATNGVGNSAPSAASNSVTPATVPNAPTIGTATAGNAQVSVTFTPPANNGGSAITGYTATCGAQSQSGPGSPIVVTGLTNGTPVTCTVIATNGVGNSAPSAASNSVTPATVPNAPTIGTATAGNAQVSVSFTPPANNGGSAITGYTATCGAQSQSGPGSPIVVTGLTNGTPVTCTVIATNGVGNSAPSAASNSVTPATVPNAPTIGVATAGNAQVSVSFTPPGNNGGSAITGYTATCGAQSQSGPGSPIVVTGLTNGTPVTCTVIATNGVGNSAPSAASNSVTPATVPDAPTIGTATAGNAQVSVTFTPPANNGGSAITGYTATCGAQSQSGPSSPIVVTGLTNGTPVTCTVIATNGVGNSAPSAASNSVTPATVPNAPTIGTATAGNAQVSVTFTPPANNGGSAITGYTATCGAQSQSGPSSPIVVTGLTNGTPVTCTVIATNAIGNSAPSAASNSVTPATVPDAPVIGAATPGNAQAQIAFSAPVNTGGSPITGYSLSCTPGPVTGSGTSSPITVTGLSNGTLYRCSVRAVNVMGPSAPSAEVSVIPSAGTSLDVSITKTNSAGFVGGGLPTTYVIVVSNAGPAGVASARVVDTLDPAFSGASWTCTGLAGGQCAASGSGNIDQLVDLPVGASVRFELTATITAVPEVPVSNLASVTVPAPLMDSNTANNVATDGPDVVGIFRDGFE